LTSSHLLGRLEVAHQTLIAVCNKLLKQFYTIIKSGALYKLILLREARPLHTIYSIPLLL
jgi:hypothetical protein